jgi:hypothetical protein
MFWRGFVPSQVLLEPAEALRLQQRLCAGEEAEMSRRPFPPMHFHSLYFEGRLKTPRDAVAAVKQQMAEQKARDKQQSKDQYGSVGRNTTDGTSET